MAKRFPSDLALSKVLTQVMFEHRMLSITFSKEAELARKFGTTPEDIELYFFGLIAPLLLTQAAFTWIFMDESEARNFIASQAEPDAQFREFKTYLANGLPLCTLMLRNEKDCRIIFEHTRQQPFKPSVYFRVGVEASHDAIVQYAAHIAERQLRKQMGY